MCIATSHTMSGAQQVRVQRWWPSAALLQASERWTRTRSRERALRRSSSRRKRLCTRPSASSRLSLPSARKSVARREALSAAMSGVVKQLFDPLTLDICSHSIVARALQPRPAYLAPHSPTVTTPAVIALHSTSKRTTMSAAAAFPIYCQCRSTGEHDGRSRDGGGHR